MQNRRSVVEPIKELDKIEIEECGEPLVEIGETCPNVLISTEGLPPSPPDPEATSPPRQLYCRKTVANMLNQAQGHLPNGYRLLIASAFRSVEQQYQIYERVLNNFKEKHPEWPYSQLRKATNRFVAPPDTKSPPPHSTGGAIDLGIVDEFRTLLDMTSPYSPFDMEQAQKVADTYSNKISERAKSNRQLLIDVMTAAGFTNYAAEWWHWSYGDSGWAWRLGKRAAIYGIAELQEE
ncbi:MAG: M15 family metallopeptidase [Candidatus Bipolaricaulia bacterium]